MATAQGMGWGQSHQKKNCASSGNDHRESGLEQLRHSRIYRRQVPIVRSMPPRVLVPRTQPIAIPQRIAMGAWSAGLHRPRGTC